VKSQLVLRGANHGFRSYTSLVLLQPFIIVGMAAALLAVAYLVEWIMEWLTSDRHTTGRNADPPSPIPEARRASRSAS